MLHSSATAARWYLPLGRVAAPVARKEVHAAVPVNGLYSSVRRKGKRCLSKRIPSAGRAPGKRTAGAGGTGGPGAASAAGGATPVRRPPSPWRRCPGRACRTLLEHPGQANPLAGSRAGRLQRALGWRTGEREGGWFQTATKVHASGRQLDVHQTGLSPQPGRPAYRPLVWLAGWRSSTGQCWDFCLQTRQPCPPCPPSPPSSLPAKSPRR